MLREGEQLTRREATAIKRLLEYGVSAHELARAFAVPRSTIEAIGRILAEHDTILNERRV